MSESPSGSAHDGRPGTLRLRAGNGVLQAGDGASRAGDVVLQAGDGALPAGEVMLQAGDGALRAGNGMLQARDVALQAGPGRSPAGLPRPLTRSSPAPDGPIRAPGHPRRPPGDGRGAHARAWRAGPAPPGRGVCGEGVWGWGWCSRGVRWREAGPGQTIYLDSGCVLAGFPPGLGREPGCGAVANSVRRSPVECQSVPVRSTSHPQSPSRLASSCRR